MDLDEAIRAAIEYEAGVHRTYQEALEQTNDEAGKRVFKVLCDEEMGHLKYLRERLDEWRKTGKIQLAKLETSIPTREAIDHSVQKLRATVAPGETGKHGAELQMLSRALEVEAETSQFYKDMVQTLDGDGRKLFERFVVIEEGHQSIVQAEIDCLSGTGFWFDTKEFDLSGG
jgi:rubrerythrin